VRSYLISPADLAQYEAVPGVRPAPLTGVRRDQAFCMCPFPTGARQRVHHNRELERSTSVAVKIKLKRMGKIRAPYYRIVVADSRTKRDGRAIEEIGKYHPKEHPSLIEVDSERVQHWLRVGAQPTEPVLALLKKTGDWQQFRGEPAPEALQVAAPRVNKKAVFEAAAKEASAETKDARDAAASSRGKRAKKAEAPASATGGGSSDSDQPGGPVAASSSTGAGDTAARPTEA
jgi:small subunit ribosomal protein S16